MDNLTQAKMLSYYCNEHHRKWCETIAYDQGGIMNQDRRNFLKQTSMVALTMLGSSFLQANQSCTPQEGVLVEFTIYGKNGEIICTGAEYANNPIHLLEVVQASCDEFAWTVNHESYDHDLVETIDGEPFILCLVNDLWVSGPVGELAFIDGEHFSVRWYSQRYDQTTYNTLKL